MKYLVILALLFSSALAGATTLAEYENKSPADRGACVANFIDKMTTDLSAKNPELAQSIRSWFTVKQPGKPLSEGMERLTVELGALDMQAKAGKVDLSTIQLEGVIVHVVKEKFQPQQAQK